MARRCAFNIAHNLSDVYFPNLVTSLFSRYMFVLFHLMKSSAFFLFEEEILLLKTFHFQIHQKLQECISSEIRKSYFLAHPVQVIVLDVSRTHTIEGLQGILNPLTK